MGERWRWHGHGQREGHGGQFSFAGLKARMAPGGSLGRMGIGNWGRGTLGALGMERGWRVETVEAGGRGSRGSRGSRDKTTPRRDGIKRIPSPHGSANEKSSKPPATPSVPVSDAALLQHPGDRSSGRLGTVSGWPVWRPHPESEIKRQSTARMQSTPSRSWKSPKASLCSPKLIFQEH